MSKNKSERVTVVQLDFKQFKSHTHKYEFLLVADPFGQNCTPEQLIEVTTHFLNHNGTLIVCGPCDTNLNSFYNNVKSQQNFRIEKL